MNHDRAIDRRPTICHVLHTLQVGGGEILAKNFAIKNSADFRPVFALLDTLGSLGDELRREGYMIEVIHRKPGFDLGCARRLGRFLRQQSVSVVHAHQYAPLFYSCLARLPTKRIPILFTEHGRDYPDYRRWKRVWANRLLMTGRDRFIGVGSDVRNSLIQYEGLPASRVDVVYNGRDLEQFKPAGCCREQVRQELGISEDALVTMQVARLNRLKDFPTAIRTVARVVSEVPRAVHIIVGDGEERECIRGLIKELGLTASVRLLGERSDVARLLQAADIFMLSSISEGIPLTMIEAMATALPCVATRVGGVPEVVEDGETGLLANPGDDIQLARHVLRLAANAPLREQLGRAARFRAVNKFDESSMHRAYRAIYRQMMSQ